MEKGKLVVLSGPSGSGKGTILTEFLKGNEDVFLSISATTRSPRYDEKDEVNYYFIGKKEFKDLIETDGILEHAKYCENYYGTPRKQVFKKLDEGKDVILEIEVQGALQVKEKCPEAVLVFVMPPSVEELEARLKGRGTEDEETVAKRLETAISEMEHLDKYDYVIVNDTVSAAIEKLEEIFLDIKK